MKYLIVAIIAAVVIFLLVLAFALCKVSSHCSREEEKMEYQAMTEMSATTKESN